MRSWPLSSFQGRTVVSKDWGGRVGILHQAHGRHQAFQPGGVDGHTQGPFPAALFHAVHGDDHVREAAQPQENIADVPALDLCLAEPGLPGVVGVLELVGAHIGHLPPVHIHQAHVHEALELALERQEDSVEGLLVGQVVKAVGMGDQTDGGGPFAEEKLHRGLRFAHHGVERVLHLPFQGAHVLGVVDAGEDQQGRHRHRDHQDGHDAPQRAVTRWRYGVRHFQQMPEIRFDCRKHATSRAGTARPVIRRPNARRPPGCRRRPVPAPALRGWR